MKNRILIFSISQLIITIIILTVIIFWWELQKLQTLNLSVMLKYIIKKAQIYFLIPTVSYLIVEFLAKKKVDNFTLKQILIFGCISISLIVWIIISYEGSFYNTDIIINEKTISSTYFQEEAIVNLIVIFLTIGTVINSFIYSVGRLIKFN
jgi:cation transport ATPase